MFFFKKPPQRHPKLLQLSEYLDLLEGGLISTAISDATKVSALNLAREVWDSLALGAWIAVNPTAVIAWRNKSSGRVLVHVPVAGDDCFLIVPLVDEAATPDSYILFDIGAEYVNATFACPAFQLAGIATENDIRQTIPELPGKADPFAILDLRGGTYMQVYADAQGFHLEHQLVTSAAHYRCVEVVGPDEAVDAFLSYAFGNYAWAYKRRWERIAV